MTATKGERTRERIVAAAAPLFNQRGYAASSMSDLMAATGLEKGGIYRHFTSKDDLALAAFDYTVARLTEQIRSLVQAERGVVRRVTALARGMVDVIERPVVPGGCPLLNTTIESDDGRGAVHSALRKRTRAAMGGLVDYTRRIIESGIDAGELSRSVNATMEAEALVGAMEGALMLSKLYDDPRYVRQAADRVAAHFKQLALATQH
jgi:TetR/AcrR family transcriptional regulator, transcriptional repressor for nem operon